jgi:hypothetical protein
MNRWLTLKYPEMYCKPQNPIIIQHICQLDTLVADVDYIIRPHIFYRTFTYEGLYLKGSDPP